MGLPHSAAARCSSTAGGAVRLAARPQRCAAAAQGRQHVWGQPSAAARSAIGEVRCAAASGSASSHSGSCDSQVVWVTAPSPAAVWLRSRASPLSVLLGCQLVGRPQAALLALTAALLLSGLFWLCDQQRAVSSICDVEELGSWPPALPPASELAEVTAVLSYEVRRLRATLLCRMAFTLRAISIWLGVCTAFLLAYGAGLELPSSAAAAVNTVAAFIFGLMIVLVLVGAMDVLAAYEEFRTAVKERRRANAARRSAARSLAPRAGA